MLQKNTFILFIVLFFSTYGFSQNENTLKNQFDAVYSRSNNYQEFKVVKKDDLNKLKTSSLDSLQVYKDALAQIQGELESQQIELGLIQNSLKEIQEKLLMAQQKENDISLFGIQTSKSAYNSIVWTLILVLLIILLFFIYKFKNSNHITRETKSKLDDLEKEYESYKQRALEKEQQLSRKLLDEMNKSK